MGLQGREQRRSLLEVRPEGTKSLVRETSFWLRKTDGTDPNPRGVHKCVKVPQSCWMDWPGKPGVTGVRGEPGWCAHLLRFEPEATRPGNLGA